MFKPNYQYTDKIVGDFVQIADARELVLNSPFIPKWEVSLRRVLHAVHQNTLDITKWLEYFVEGVKVSIAVVKERVVRLSSERLRKGRLL